MEHWGASMTAIVGKDGTVLGKGKKGQYILNTAGKEYLKKHGESSEYMTIKNNIIGSKDMWNYMMENGMINDVINGPRVAEGNAGIIERNTASHASGMDMFGSGDWLTKGRFWEDNILRQDTLASGSLLSIGGTLG